MEIKISESDLIENFPFKEIRAKQLEGMKQIAQAINDGYRIIVLEAPTGFGKSPVAIALGRTLGSSYICSATKDLQSQYTKDFPFLRSVKGMSNFDCLAKEDFILNKTYICKSCKIDQRGNNNTIDSDISSSSFNNIEECKHKTVAYGPCREGNNAYEHVPKNCPICRVGGGLISDDFHMGCRYRTFPEDYEVINENTDQETVFINEIRLAQYHEYSTDKEDWMHLTNIKTKKALENRTFNDFAPCGYYDQLSKGIVASHTIFNYANFLIFLRQSGPFAKNPILVNRGLLVLDEGHQIENQIVEEVGINVSKKTLQRYISTDILENSKLNYDSDVLTEWAELLDALYTRLFDSIPAITAAEIKTDAKQYLKKLAETIAWIKRNPDNWIVSEIVREDDRDPRSKINKIVFKPLDVSPYCRPLYELADITLIMSATILDVDTFCRNVGLDRSRVKFIEIGF